MDDDSTSLWGHLLKCNCSTDFVLGAEAGLIYAVLAGPGDSPDEMHMYEVARSNAELIERIATSYGWRVTWGPAANHDDRHMATATFTRAAPPRPKLTVLRRPT